MFPLFSNFKKYNPLLKSSRFICVGFALKLTLELSTTLPFISNTDNLVSPRFTSAFILIIPAETVG